MKQEHKQTNLPVEYMPDGQFPGLSQTNERTRMINKMILIVNGKNET